jgi:uncharacterized protein (DUF2147 family)
MKMAIGVLLAVCASFSADVVMADEPSAVGFWVTPDHGAVVQVSQCGGALCGMIVGVRTDHKPGEMPRDTHNPDPAKRDRPTCGMMMMGSLVPAKGGAVKWDGGWVYDPESGNTYKGAMQLEGADTLNLRGYLGISLFGRTQTWTRETGENKNRCAVSAAG